MAYWSAWWPQQAVCGYRVAPFALDNRCNLSGLWGTQNGFASWCKRSFHQGVASSKTLFKIIEKCPLPVEIWANMTLFARFSLWLSGGISTYPASRGDAWGGGFQGEQIHPLVSSGSPCQFTASGPQTDRFQRGKKTDSSVRFCSSAATSAQCLGWSWKCASLQDVFAVAGWSSPHIYKILKSGHEFNPRTQVLLGWSNLCRRFTALIGRYLPSVWHWWYWHQHHDVGSSSIRKERSQVTYMTRIS